ncbi:Phosphoribosylformimino-5-aminoimidazole carboxamide ribotide isomerase [Prochlorococcus marinus str. SS51]|nr:Phosphoribosylformimino-5-aminoimidazole carboxamide ribotide isomerase [Prochlorococcus marinus str. SS2]KGG32152.1 Phosphoribosylformimino-5-aminoimidazole carboxamide ribotide isomerase [Prochlorococcus marinus str. SS51]
MFVIEIIPAIDLLKGSCVRLVQGDYNEVTEFNDNPSQQALLWQTLGAKRLHLVDLDGAKTGEPLNDSAIRKIKEKLSIPIQIGGGIRTIQRAEDLIELGVDRVILGTIAIENPNIIEKLSEKHPNKIVVGIDAKEGKVATRGWTNNCEMDATELVKRFSQTNIAAIICTDISTDGTLMGPNLDFLRELALISTVPLIASGGIGSISDILSILPLEQNGINGLIIGRALYDGAFDLAEALKVVKNQDLQDIVNANKDQA